MNKYSNILYNTNYVYSVPNETFKGKPLNSDIDVAIYDKIGKKLLIIECKWKENVYQNRENYIRIEDALKKYMIINWKNIKPILKEILID